MYINRTPDSDFYVMLELDKLQGNFYNIIRYSGWSLFNINHTSPEKNTNSGSIHPLDTDSQNHMQYLLLAYHAW
jgi:hypothetical protein